MKRAHVLVNGHWVGDFPILPLRDARGEDRPVDEGDHVQVIVTDDAKKSARPIYSVATQLRYP